jgi:hypothetical protein
MKLNLLNLSQWAYTTLRNDDAKIDKKIIDVNIEIIIIDAQFSNELLI